MVGFVIGSKAHYEFLKGRLIEISNKLKTAKKLNLSEKSELFFEELDIMDQILEYFPNGEPE